MGLFDEFRRAINGDQAAGERAFSQAFQYAAIAVDPAYQKLFSNAVLPWFDRLAKRVPMAWFHPEVQRKCSMSLETGQCKARAAAMCVLCRRNVCLTHALVSCDATVLCAMCMNVARKHVEPVVNSGPTEEERVAATKKSSAVDLHKAWKVLGLEQDADDEEIERSYKDLMVRWHPDKAKTPEKKAKYEKKFKEVRWAYDTIQVGRQ